MISKQASFNQKIEGKLLMRLTHMVSDQSDCNSEDFLSSIDPMASFLADKQVNTVDINEDHIFEEPKKTTLRHKPHNWMFEFNVSREVFAFVLGECGLF